MKFTREQVIEMRQRAGIAAAIELDCVGEFHPDFDAVADEQFATLAADAALEAAALECEKYDSLRIDGAGETIRAMKEKP